MKSNEQLFLQLLRAGLWGKCNEIVKVPPTAWEDIYDIAHRQACLGIVYDGIQLALPPDERPPRPLWLRWTHKVLRIEQANTQHNHLIEELTLHFQKQNLTPILLKGQGVAQYYPQPLHRQCGDIDIYFTPAEYQKAKELIVHLGGKERHPENNNHQDYMYKGTIVECHRRIDKLFTKKQIKQWQEYVDEFLDQDVPTLSIGNIEIGLLRPEVNLLFIVLHAYSHLFSSGVGLRQFCDWTLLLDKTLKTISVSEFSTVLSSMRLERIWAIMGCIVVEYLGFPAETMPFYNPKYRKAAEKIMTIIWREGNFGHFDTKRGLRPPDYWSGKIYSLRQKLRRIYKMINVFPRESIEYILHMPYGSFRRIWLEKFSNH